jgi:hypothetical protein
MQLLSSPARGLLAIAAIGAVAAPGAVVALPDGVISLPLQRIKNQTAYGVELFIGTPPQRVVTSVDTGSPTYAVESRRKLNPSRLVQIMIVKREDG